jgi:hypothetical protein
VRRDDLRVRRRRVEGHQDLTSSTKWSDFTSGTVDAEVDDVWMASDGSPLPVHVVYQLTLSSDHAITGGARARWDACVALLDVGGSF